MILFAIVGKHFRFYHSGKVKFRKINVEILETRSPNRVFHSAGIKARELSLGMNFEELHFNDVTETLSSLSGNNRRKSS